MPRLPGACGCGALRTMRSGRGAANRGGDSEQSAHQRTLALWWVAGPRRAPGGWRSYEARCDAARGTAGRGWSVCTCSARAPAAGGEGGPGEGPLWCAECCDAASSEDVLGAAAGCGGGESPHQRAEGLCLGVWAAPRRGPRWCELSCKEPRRAVTRRKAGRGCAGRCAWDLHLADAQIISSLPASVPASRHASAVAAASAHLAPMRR